MPNLFYGCGELLSSDLLLLVVPLTPSLNELIKWHPMKRHRHRRNMQVAVNACIRQAMGTTWESPWTEQAEFTAVRCSTQRRRIDETNLRGGCKPVEDAIVEAGIVPNDSPKYVTWGKVEDRIQSMWDDLQGPATYIYIRSLSDDVDGR